MDMRIRDFRQLHNAFLHDWEDWVYDAPPQWKQDRFLLDNDPVALTVLYGQNQEICGRIRDRDVERHHWQSDHDYSHLHSAIFSIATHISYVLSILSISSSFLSTSSPLLLRFSNVESWIPVPMDTILANGDLYDRPLSDPDRHLVDLVDLDLFDDDGQEIHIYSRDGFRIPRRVPDDHTSGGALLDLTKAPELFLPDPDALDLHPSADQCTLYPLAFTKTLGNMQANGLIYQFQQRLRTINDPLQRHDFDPVACDLFDDPDLLAETSPPVVKGVRCQVYNALSHRVRERAKFHGVQLGNVTAALSGIASATQASKSTWRRRVRECRIALPHQEFANKVAGPDQPEDSRWENTYVIDVQRLSQQNQNGGYALLFLSSSVSPVYSRVLVSSASSMMKSSDH